MKPNEMQMIEAHDILDMVCRGETPLNPSNEVRARMREARDVLCWVLGHEERREVFQGKIDCLKREVLKHGTLGMIQ